MFVSSAPPRFAEKFVCVERAPAHKLAMPSKRPRASGASDTTVVEKPAKAAHAGVCVREHVERPPIVPLDLAWVKGVKINSASVKRRAAEIPTRRTVKKDWQAAWLLRAVTSAPRKNLRRARRPAPAPPDGEEGLAGGVAAARRDQHRPDDTGGR